MNSLLEDLVNEIWDKGFCEECKPPNKGFIRLDISNILDKHQKSKISIDQQILDQIKPFISDMVREFLFDKFEIRMEEYEKSFNKNWNDFWENNKFK